MLPRTVILTKQCFDYLIRAIWEFVVAKEIDIYMHIMSDIGIRLYIFPLNLFQSIYNISLSIHDKENSN